MVNRGHESVLFRRCFSRGGKVLCKQSFGSVVAVGKIFHLENGILFFKIKLKFKIKRKQGGVSFDMGRRFIEFIQCVTNL